MCATSIASIELSVVEVGATQTAAGPQSVVGDDTGQGPAQPGVQALGIATCGIQNKQRLAGLPSGILGGAHQRSPYAKASRAAVHQTSWICRRDGAGSRVGQVQLGRC